MGFEDLSDPYEFLTEYDNASGDDRQDDSRGAGGEELQELYSPELQEVFRRLRMKSEYTAAVPTPAPTPTPTPAPASREFVTNTLPTSTYTVTPGPLVQRLVLTPKKRDVRHLLELTASALGRPTTRDRDALTLVLPAPGIPWDTFWTKLIHDRRTPDEELGRLFHQLDLAGAAWINKGAKHNWQGTVGPYERYEEWRGWYRTASQVMEGQGRCYFAVDPETTWEETQREMQCMAEGSDPWSEDDYEPTAEESFISKHLAPDVADALYDARRNAMRARYFVEKVGGESGEAATSASCAEQLCAQAFQAAKARNPTGARFFADSAAVLAQAAVAFTLSEKVKGGPPTLPLSTTPSFSKQQQRKLRRKGQKTETGGSTRGSGKSNGSFNSSGSTTTTLSSPPTNAVATTRKGRGGGKGGTGGGKGGTGGAGVGGLSVADGTGFLGGQNINRIIPADIVDDPSVSGRSGRGTVCAVGAVGFLGAVGVPSAGSAAPRRDVFNYSVGLIFTRSVSRSL